MSYREHYEKWLNSSALSEAEKAELRALDEKEIEARFLARWNLAPLVCEA